jgi:hypothetical protein
LPLSDAVRILDGVETVVPAPSLLNQKSSARRRRLTSEGVIKAFFGSNALVAIVVLALITVFLFREGFGFFDQNLNNLRIYRRAGRSSSTSSAKTEQHSASRGSSALSVWRKAFPSGRRCLTNFDQFAGAFSDAAEDLNGLVSEASDRALALRDTLLGQVKSGGGGGESSEGALRLQPSLRGMVALRPRRKSLERRGRNDE